MRKSAKPLENYEETKQKALRLLEFRNHSEKELSLKLSAAGAKSEDIEKTLEFLREYHLVNDEAYARALAQDLRNLKKYGVNRIKSELLSKGIATYIIDEAISELPEAEENLLFELVKKRMGGKTDQKTRDKTMRYFIYRGYSIDEIKQCINKISAECE